MWRLLDTGFADCYTNMAVDEAIFLEFAAGCIPPTLRIYGWRPTAFSLGCSQNPQHELDIERCKKENISFVRRMTGGSIICHDKELTYSLVCRIKDIGSDYSVRESYKVTCSFLINTYKRLGLAPRFSGEGPGDQEGRSFCFASREKYDIVINGRKIGGNAQKRQKDIIFQHGSIPLKLDIERAFYFLKNPPPDSADKAISLNEATGRETNFDELKEAIKRSFEETFSVKLSEQNLTRKEKGLADRLTIQKYQTPRWNLSRDEGLIKKARVA